MNKKIAKIIITLLIISLSLGACSSIKSETSKEQTKTEDAKIDVENTKEPVIVLETETETKAELEETSKKETNDAADSTWFFTTTDLDGNEINTKDFFADSKLTLVNIWGTFCGPCKAELPDLGKIARDFADKDVQLLGITSDALSNNSQMIDVAKGLLNDANVEYTNLTTNDDVIAKALQQVFAIPTTYLVDSNGVVIGEPVIGGNNYEFFANLIENGLKEVDNKQ